MAIWFITCISKIYIHNIRPKTLSLFCDESNDNWIDVCFVLCEFVPVEPSTLLVDVDVYSSVALANKFYKQ